MITHMACIMDGNRRWALRHKFKPWIGHRKGVESMRRAMKFCIKKNIAYLSLYSFSLENLTNRSEPEQDFLFNTLAHELYKELDDFVAQDIRIRFIGDRARFPKQVIPLCDEVERKTVHLKKLNLQLLLCYGGRQEITAGIKKIVTDVQAGKLCADTLTPEQVERYLWMGGIPDPELIVRTGGVKRLSNFLTYQSIYSELYFLDMLWPEVQESDLQGALDYYSSCRRNFGK